ncbi:MAG: aminodeoxychorismate lyase [Halieaceae bacterium]|nr:aminodeoxychorismate lyase [Halieaceae bacterium]
MPEGTQYWCDAASTGELPLPDRGMEFGDGLFETLLCVDGKLLFPERHQVRLEQGFHQLGFNGPAPDLEALISPATEAIAQSTAAVLRLTLTRSAGLRGYAPGDGTAHRCVLRLTPLNHDPLSEPVPLSLGVAGIRLAHQPALAGIKHLNRLEQVLIKSETLPAGYQDWLVIDAQDNIVESSMANLFFVTGKHIVTPSISRSGVAGMMREQVIYALLEAGYDVEARPIAYSHLCHYQHVFMTNSLVGILDINHVDDVHFTHADVTQQIRQTLHLTL